MMKTFARASRSASLVSFAFLAAACGDVEDAAQTVQDGVVDGAHTAGDAFDDGVDSVSDAMDDWLNDPPLKQRHEMCEREGGSWVKRIDVSACEDGRATLHLLFNEGEERDIEQACNGGDGLTYDHQCLHMDDKGEPYFNDGPSSPHLLQAVVTALHDDLDQFQWNELFWDAAVNHDYCYHHGAYRDLAQEDCDEQFHIDMTSVCARNDLQDEEWFGKDLCESQANAMFSAVRSGGSSSYAAMSTHANYPTWTPLWKRFGMSEQPEVGSTFTESVSDVVAAF